MTFLAYAFIIIASIVAPNLFSPAGAALGDGTYPEEVHQLVLQKLNKLHGRTDPDHLGQWGAWSTWTPCSRSCGTGVSTQSRECLPPRKRQKRKLHKGENGEFDCIGRFTRYQLCNRQMCPRGLTDFRAEQCASYNRSPFNNRFYKWEPFIDGIDSCTLNCRAVGMSFYATLNQSVIDGTPCGQRAHRTRDRYCVHGNCMIVGCDGLLGSGRKADACGICGGDNSTCRMISGVYGRPSLPFGYNLIATLPPGATNLSIYHVKPSTNYLALRELGGNYILNGPWGMNSSGSFEASGTVFTYSRPHAHGGDHLYARGPTTHSVDIMLFYQNTNPGIKYEYRLPLTSSVRSPGSKDRLNRVTELTKPDNHHYNKIAPGVLGRGTDKNTSPLYFESGKASWSRRPDSAQGKTQYSISSNKAPKRKPRDRYVWVSKGFTECSRSCGGGTMSTRFICMKKKKVGSEVPPYFCSNVAQPKETVITCNSNPCPPQWEATSWSDCSVTCGLGVQVRKLICKQATSSGTTIALSEDECGKASTLRTAQVCQMRDCDGPPSWEAGLWSDCSSQCGLGTRRRKVTCSAVSGTVSEELCKEAKPQTEEICDMGSCASDTWFFSEWDSICRGSCGQGLQKRRVHCSGDSLQGQRPSTSCPSAVKPDEVRSCASKARCGSVWFTGPWGDCDARCGVGRQRRAVVCLTWHKGRYKVAKSDATCSSEEEKPQDVRSCVLECHAEWFTSDWSKCSAPCDGGVQRREVKCLDHNLQPSIECHSHAKPDSRQSCNTKSCNERNTGKEVRVENEVLDPRRPIFSGSPNVSNKYNPPGKRYEYLERGETSYVRGDNYGSQSKSQDPDGESSSGKGNVHNTNNHRSFPETSETGETLTNETPFPAHTNVEAPETSQTLRNVFDSGKRLNSQNSSNLGGNYDSLDSEGSQPSSPEGSTVEESSVNKRGGVKKEPTPGQPLKSGLCMDRMKNCHLVYKARLCKLKYYNKLCCDTCTN